jgi:hypothetical protein
VELGNDHTADVAVWPSRRVAVQAVRIYRKGGPDTKPVDAPPWPGRVVRVDRFENVTVAWYNRPTPGDRAAFKRALLVPHGGDQYARLWIIPRALMDSSTASGSIQSASYQARIVLGAAVLLGAQTATSRLRSGQTGRRPELLQRVQRRQQRGALRARQECDDLVELRPHERRARDRHGRSALNLGWWLPLIAAALLVVGALVGLIAAFAAATAAYYVGGPTFGTSSGSSSSRSPQPCFSLPRIASAPADCDVVTLSDRSDCKSVLRKTRFRLACCLLVVYELRTGRSEFFRSAATPGDGSLSWWLKRRRPPTADAERRSATGAGTKAL